MLSLSLSLVPLPLSLAGFLPLQDEPGPVRPERVLTPAEVVTGPPPHQRPSEQRDVVPLEASFEPVVLDDEVPLPQPALGKPGAAGDQLLQEASGDPYFLGFAAGPYAPPEDELVDPALLERRETVAHQRPGDFTYAFVMFSKRMTDERLAQLEAAGCRLLGFHPHYTMKVALSPDALSRVSTLPFVRWVGTPRRWQKLHPALRPVLESPADELQVVVNVYESDLGPASVGTPVGRIVETQPGAEPVVRSDRDAEDLLPRTWQSNGWQHLALQQAGLEIRWYEPSTYSFVGSIPRARFDDLLGLDFVQFVEPVPQEETNSAPHDESCAMIMSDSIRNSYPGDTNQVAIVGIQDSGVEVSHWDLGIWGVGWDCTNLADPWSDAANGGSGHGTHVSGTLLGRGVSEADQLGNAPGLASWGGTSRLFSLRRFGGTGCTWSFDTCLSVFGSSYTDGSGNTTAVPHLVTNSWGFYYDTNGNGQHDGGDLGGIGTESQCRSLDDFIYDNDQLHVYSSANAGPGASTLNINASAKNVLTVGNVVDYIDGGVGDPGNIWTSSSRGPARDGRWKPNVAAPGRWIRSALANDNDGYANYSGTSMAAPHVSAVAATLVDHYSWLRYAPARLSSLLMASAITDNNQTLSTPSDAHLDSYGTGRINAYKAHWGTSDFTFSNWGFDQTNANWFFGDFTVPAGTTRLVAVMHYVEEQCSAGASQALVNDYDLWLDRDPIDGAGNSGEYFAQQSTLDNTEIRIVDSPPTGPWRWKTYPDSANSNVVKMSVTIYYIYDDTTPDASFSVGVNDNCVQPGQTVLATATVQPTSYIGSAVVLDRSGSTATLQSSSTTLYDGLVTDLTDSAMAGTDIVLGDVLYSNDRAGTWGLSYATEGVKSITVNARSDNMVNKNATVNVTVDGTDPGLVTNLGSSDHVLNVWSNDPTITYTWTPATDNLSGIQGYGIFESTGCGLPSAVLDIGPVSSYTTAALPSSTLGYYFNIRSVDNCDNWDADYACTGPYFVDVTPPGAPTFNSSDHVVGGTSCDPDITVNWNAAGDAHSGVAGYSVLWTGAANSCPNTAVNTGGTSWSSTLGAGTWYLHVRAVDNAGNWADCSSVGHFGPFTIVGTCELFFDDFESGGFVAGGWENIKKAKVLATAAHDGAFGARIRRRGMIQKTFDFTGYQGAVLELWRLARNYDPADNNEGFRIRVHDGVSWTTLDLTSQAPWEYLTLPLPASCDNNPKVIIRFKSKGNEGKENGEVDNVRVTASSL